MSYHVQSLSQGKVELSRVYSSMSEALLHVQDELNRGHEVLVHSADLCEEHFCEKQARGASWITRGTKVRFLERSLCGNVPPGTFGHVIEARNVQPPQPCPDHVTSRGVCACGSSDEGILPATPAEATVLCDLPRAIQPKLVITPGSEGRLWERVA